MYIYCDKFILNTVELKTCIPYFKKRPVKPSSYSNFPNFIFKYAYVPPTPNDKRHIVIKIHKIMCVFENFNSASF